MLRHVALVIVAVITTAACSPSPSATPRSDALIERARTDKAFDDVVFELEFAITERNFRITGRNTIGKGLRERGYDDFPDVEVIHFCNLEYAREVLEIDPGYVSLILLPEDHADARINAFARRMNAILREIVEFVLEQDAAAEK